MKNNESKNGKQKPPLPDKETAQIQRVALYAFLLNLFLSIMKGVLALVSGSLAVTAGALDSVTDSFASLAVYGGLKLSTRKTRTFPLGLCKIENIISIVVAFFIFFAGYEILGRITDPSKKPPQISLTLILLLLAAALLTFLFGQYAMAAGKKTESPALMAEGRHRQTDVLSTIVIWVSVLLQYLKIDFSLWGISIDQVAAGIVLVFVAHTGWELLSNGMRVLLDASIDHETMDKIRKVIHSHPAVIEIRSLVGRNAGRFRFLQCTIRLRTNDLKKAHQISEQIEQQIRKAIPHVERVMIHYEPAKREFLHIAVPLSDREGTIGTHFGETPHFALIKMRLSDYHVENKTILDNPYKLMPRGKGIRVAEWLINEKIDTLIVREDLKHKGPGYVLANAGVDVQVVQAATLNEALRNPSYL